MAAPGSGGEIARTQPPRPAARCTSGREEASRTSPRPLSKEGGKELARPFLTFAPCCRQIDEEDDLETLGRLRRMQLIAAKKLEQHETRAPPPSLSTYLATVT